MTQVASLRRHSACVKIVVENKAVIVKKDRKALSGRELFMEFYKKQKSTEAPERLVNVFADYLAKAEEGENEAD